MSGISPRFLEGVRGVAETLAPAVVAPVAAAIAGTEPGRWGLLRLRAQDVAGGPAAREAVGRLIACWEREAPELAPAAAAATLEAMAHCAAQARAAQTLEIAWTGPTSSLPLRRTAQALRQLIDAAERELLIVAFAVYDIPEISAALIRAAERGVALRLAIESPKEAAGHVAYDGLLAFSPQLRQRARVYRWPPEQRPKDAAGRHGSLHVKCAVADERALFISSANLTHYALNLNMEMGLLIHGGDLPRQVARHFEDLVHAGVLVHAMGAR